jgi:hypothetical protein
MIEPQFTIQALDNIRPGAEWVLRGWEIEWKEEQDDAGNIIIVTPNFDWQDSVQDKPTQQEIAQAIDDARIGWQTSEYQRQRRPEYPPLADLADALYWQSKGNDAKMAAYLAAVDAVKIKYPKEPT